MSNRVGNERQIEFKTVDAHRFRRPEKGGPRMRGAPGAPALESAAIGKLHKSPLGKCLYGKELSTAVKIFQRMVQRQLLLAFESQFNSCLISVVYSVFDLIDTRDGLAKNDSIDTPYTGALMNFCFGELNNFCQRRGRGPAAWVLSTRPCHGTAAVAAKLENEESHALGRGLVSNAIGRLFRT